MDNGYIPMLIEQVSAKVAKSFVEDFLPDFWQKVIQETNAQIANILDEKTAASEAENGLTSGLQSEKAETPKEETAPTTSEPRKDGEIKTAALAYAEDNHITLKAAAEKFGIKPTSLYAYKKYRKSLLKDTATSVAPSIPTPDVSQQPIKEADAKSASVDTAYRLFVQKFLELHVLPGPESVLVKKVLEQAKLPESEKDRFTIFCTKIADVVDDKSDIWGEEALIGAGVSKILAEQIVKVFPTRAAASKSLR